MARLFRKFRLQFLNQEKSSKYFLYALGEIFLIVIGILIALGINNWNQNKQIRKREQFYLSGLKKEFENSKLKLEKLIEVNKLNYNQAKKLSIIIAKDSIIDEEELSKLLYHSFSNEIAYNPNNSLLSEIINSGSLKHISDSQLRKHLTNWDSQLQSVNRQEEALREEREHILDLFRSNNGSNRTVFDLSDISTDIIGIPKATVHKSNSDLILTDAFENNILMFILTGIATETSHYEPLLGEINKILDLTEANLK